VAFHRERLYRYCKRDGLVLRYLGDEGGRTSPCASAQADDEYDHVAVECQIYIA
jgi:hypothetical protein